MTDAVETARANYLRVLKEQAETQKPIVAEVQARMQAIADEQSSALAALQTQVRDPNLSATIGHVISIVTSAKGLAQTVTARLDRDIASAVEQGV